MRFTDINLFSSSSDGVKDTSLKAKDSTLKAKTKNFKIVLEDSNTGHLITVG